MSPLARRLAFVVQGIDAGRFREPEDAVNAILETIGSIYPPHRMELAEWLERMGVLVPKAWIDETRRTHNGYTDFATLGFPEEPGAEWDNAEVLYAIGFPK